MTVSYIPAKDADLLGWLDNFDTIVAVDFAALGLTGGEAATITGVRTAYDTAYVDATTPATRTPVTVATKDVAKATALATVRPLAQKIRNNPAVLDATKVSLGLTVPDTSPTPIPAPLTFPLLDLLSATPGQHHLQYRDSDTPTTKAKPFGADGMELWSTIGTSPAIDPSGASYLGLITKSPLAVDLDVADVGKYATYFGRWITRRGLVGPWSSPVSLTVAF
jgi:hypothetical protein